MKNKNRIFIIFGIVFTLILLGYNNVSASKYEFENICEDLDELEIYATEYKELFPEDTMSENELVLDYIRNDIYDESLGYNTLKNIEFSAYISEISNDYDYLKYIETINTPLGNINFSFLISAINSMNNDEDINWIWSYLISQQILNDLSEDSDLEKTIKLNKLKYNKTDINTIIDASNIYTDLSQKNISEALKTYFNKYTLSKRFNSFTSENLGIYEITKINVRDNIYNLFINNEKVSKILGDAGLTLFSDDFKIKSFCYAFADYIYENHPLAIKETIVPEVILTNDIIVNIPTDLYIGDSIILDIKITPENATNKKYKITTDNDNISIKDNKLTAIKLGKTNVTIETDDKVIKSVYTINIIKDNVSLKSEIKDYSLIVGDTKKLEYTLEGSNKEDVNFKSLDESTVYVDNYGVIKALKEGKTKIIASLKDAADVTISWEIIISDKKEETYTIENKENNEVYKCIVLNKKDKYLLKIKGLYEDELDKIKFKSESPDIINIDDKGNIEAINSGRTKVSILTEDNSKVLDTCEILILYDISRIDTEEDSITFDLSEKTSYPLNFSVTPEEVNLSTIEYRFYDKLKDSLVTNNSIYYDKETNNIIASDTGSYKLSFYDRNTSKIVGECEIIITESNSNKIAKDKNQSNILSSLLKISLAIVIFLGISLVICSVFYIYFFRKDKKEENKIKELNKNENKIKVDKQENIKDVDKYINDFRVDISDYLDDEDENK